MNLWWVMFKLNSNLLGIALLSASAFINAQDNESELVGGIASDAVSVAELLRQATDNDLGGTLTLLDIENLDEEIEQESISPYDEYTRKYKRHCSTVVPIEEI